MSVAPVLETRALTKHYAVSSGVFAAAASVRARVWLRSPMGRVAHIAPRGLLLISPGADRLVSPHQSQRMFRAAGEPKELFVVPEAAHAEAHLTNPGAYESRVLDFLARHLDGEAPV